MPRQKSNDARNEEVYVEVQDHLDESDNSTAPNKDEVVNAYRDYLKSIRDGGFESYLDGHDEPLAGSRGSRSKRAGGEDDALERVLDIAEERRGVFYGAIYGDQDMRSASSSYKAWRAKAKTLLKDLQHQRDGDLSGLSSTRRELNKPRDERRAISQANGSRASTDASPKGSSYMMPILHSPLFKILSSGCIVLALVLFLSMSSYGSEKSHDEDFAWDVSSAESGGPPPSWKDPQPQLNGQPDAIVNTIRAIDPKWYNSSSGWEGVTFVDSVNFCASHDRVPCPFDLDWDILEHEHVAGDITQNILCCLDVHRTGTLDPLTEWGADDLEDHVEGAITLEATSNTFLGLKDASSELKPDMDEQKRERTVIAAFHPIWFSKSHGWSGSSYEDGILFCESYNHMVLCPYAAYCPNGDGKQVLPGSLVRDIDGEQWVPANGPMNTWVQIGRIDGDERTRCTLHHDLYGERPEDWGIDGSRTELNQHIMCCKM